MTMLTVGRDRRSRERRRNRQNGHRDEHSLVRLLRPRDLREQFERAAWFQRSLLPDVSEPIGQFCVSSVYLPRDSVGGDFYDLARRPECALLLVADVMGHGVGAALVTMLVKAAFQETASTITDPDALLAAMNGRLLRVMPPGMYVAAAVARLDLAGADLHLANAGLPHPFVLRASEGRVEEIGVDGFPLGLFEGLGPTTYDVSQVALASGDVLLLASDGVGSIEDPGGQCFGEGRLAEALHRLVGCEGRDLLDRLVDAAVAFGDGQPRPDDIDLVAIARQAIPAQAVVA